eukprot:TRINITY_DN111536_c0_g1_i1.p1 TRINITY_DN111536_c0_g1~~TRINITY_DN111536_c0_g1_i1.p1  ORF type:complete len:198 (-),score=34.10 TRINITY_DN111536_c0_g1_i1:356-949(-)
MLALRQAATAGVIGCVGDLLMQHREGVESFDPYRTGRLAIFRVFQAPWVDAMWRMFDRVVPFKGPLGVATKVVADQTLIMPPSMLTFFFSMGVMEGLEVQEAAARSLASFPSTAQASLPYWCTIHSVTFSVIPPNWRIAWAATCAVAWNAFISGQNQKARTTEKNEQEGFTLSEAVVIQREQKVEKQDIVQGVLSLE